MTAKLGKLSTGWRILVALALVFAMVPAVVVATTSTADAQVVGPVIDDFKAFCICPGCPPDAMTFTSNSGQGGLYGECVEFVVEADSQGDGDLCYLEIDLYGCGGDCVQYSAQLMQLNFAADSQPVTIGGRSVPGVFQDWMTPGNCGTHQTYAWSEADLDLAEEMGLHVDLCYYDPVDEDWHIFLDLTKLWSADDIIPSWPYPNLKGDPVFPKCCENGDREQHTDGYQICIEVGDSEGLIAGNNTQGVGADECVECYDADFYGMHLLQPNEYEPICTTEGCQVDVNWNFHADCQPTEDFLIEIYDPLTPGMAGWASVPNVYTVSDLNISECALGTATVTLLQGVPDGVYNVRITGQCLDTGQCLKRVEERGAVIIDTIDPVVVVEANLDGNYKDSDTFDLNWTMDDNTGVTSAKIDVSLNCGQTWVPLRDFSVDDGQPDDSKIWWDGNIGYGAEIHVGATGGEPWELNWGPDDNESCHMAHVRVTAEDCGGNQGDDETGEPGLGFTIDNTAPTTNDDDATGLRVTGEVASAYCQDDCLIGGSDVNILFDYNDNCGPLTAKLEYQACGGDWITIVDGLVLPGTNGDDYAYPWTVPPTLDCCEGDGGIDFRLTITDCPGQTAQATYETCVEAPLIMVDCITGWCGEWQHAKWLPKNCNARDTIMVVFNKPLDLATVSISDFQVVGKTITGIDIYKDPNISGQNGGVWQGYTYVYLTVTPLMATDAKPTVKLVGCVSAEDPNIDPLCGDVEPVECIAQDGIAPILTVTASPENPGHNEEVTVTVTASECLNEAYLMIGKGSPNDYNFNWCKPIGWPTDWWTQGWDKRVPKMPPLPPDCPKGPYPEWGTIPMDEQGNELRACIWENWDHPDCCMDHGCDWNWFAMDAEVDQACNRDMNMETWDGSKTWTYTFYNRYGANFDWFVEVAGHDYSHWLPTYPWKHEKWTQESYLFWSDEYDYIELCEGWNLVSVPWNLVDPTPAGAFGIAGHKGYSGITKAYYYTGGQYGTWQYTALNPVTGAWTGTLTSIVPGKAYWVWCSPPWMDWMLRMVEPDPLSVPPTQTVKKGWNMLGLTMMQDYNWHSNGWQIKAYLIGLRDLGPTHLYFYDTCGDSGYPWIRLHSGGETSWSWGDNDWPWGWGAWFWANADDSFGP